MESIPSKDLLIKEIVRLESERLEHFKRLKTIADSNEKIKNYELENSLIDIRISIYEDLFSEGIIPNHILQMKLEKLEKKKIKAFKKIIGSKSNIESVTVVNYN